MAEFKKVDKKILGGHEKVRIAGIQASQILFNKQKSVEKACRMIKEAAANGAQLVAFSETYLPCFPAYYNSGYASDTAEWYQFWTGLVNNSIVVAGEETEAIGKACREAGVFCVMGINELDERPATSTMYNSQVLFGPDGNIIARHRKTTPTFNERVYWGQGDGSTMGAFDSEIGRLGMLVCGEHYTLLIKTAQQLLGEEIHVANFPGSYRPGQPGEKFLMPDETGHSDQLYFMSQAYALSGACFVVTVNGLLRDEDIEPEYENFKTSPNINYGWANGGAFVVGPLGNRLSGERIFGEETIVYGDCYAADILANQAFFDTKGHYSRPDVASLTLNKKANQNLYTVNDQIAVPSYKRIQEISEEYEVKLQKLEDLANRLETKLSE